MVWKKRGAVRDLLMADIIVLGVLPLLALAVVRVVVWKKRIAATWRRGGSWREAPPPPRTLASPPTSPCPATAQHTPVPRDRPLPRARTWTPRPDYPPRQALLAGQRGRAGGPAVRCRRTPTCNFYGHPETGDYCSCCYSRRPLKRREPETATIRWLQPHDEHDEADEKDAPAGCEVILALGQVT
ncbi:hypothetical protein AAFF_G00120380 [Aldrovandia affinis]|uniref:A20-type domain-containing protein n=1 Tax=Aldrovandia affinis TaxID=143900 RepID=A0AAD7VX49_9TELE|nr:hypothetical protein AAFF_G00120380 [Aldrovandia affinis]